MGGYIKTKQFVGQLNFVLIIVSFILAVNFPFAWFLIVYAILGPLHYLTEINWIDKKASETKEVNKRQTFVFFAVVSLIVVAISNYHYLFSWLNIELDNNALTTQFIKYFLSFLVLATFVYALMINIQKQQSKYLFTIILSLGIALLLSLLPFLADFSYLYLPSLVHVYIFTLFFMVNGAIKSKKNKWELLNVMLVLCVPFIIWLYPVDMLNVNVLHSVKVMYSDSSFGFIVEHVANFFQPKGSDQQFYLLSELGVKIQIFITFSYTYHYLNWFSKTTVIGWHKTLTKKKSVIILTLWLIMVAMYLVNFKLGIITSLFLSYFHVFLEFPLNLSSIKFIFYKLRNKKRLPIK